LPLTREKKKELIAPDAQRIFAGKDDGVPNPPPEVLNPNGALVPSKELTYFRQGYQRGWTEAATVRLIWDEAEEQGIGLKDPEWPDYKEPTWVGKATVKNVPTPAGFTAAYNCGYFRGWEASKTNRSAEKLFKKRIIANKLKKPPVKKAPKKKTKKPK
jgi:hypothetical protein